MRRNAVVRARGGREVWDWIVVGVNVCELGALSMACSLPYQFF